MLYKFFYSLTDKAVVLRVFIQSLYGYGLQSILLFVLSITLSVASAPTVGYSLALSLDAALPIVLTIVHFGGTSILSLHTI
jgi:uncharacterized membrane protein